jgi:hypothetical protein
MSRTRFAPTIEYLRGALAWGILAVAVLLAHARPAAAEALPEYRLKAMFVYNFVLFTEWPDDVGGTLVLCVYGRDPFGAEIDALHGKQVGNRSISVQRRGLGEPLKDCQIVFIASPAIAAVPLVLEQLRGSPVLTIADSPGATRLGVALNLSVAADRVTFEANLQAARGAGLNLSSKLLRLATQVVQ